MKLTGTGHNILIDIAKEHPEYLYTTLEIWMDYGVKPHVLEESSHEVTTVTVNSRKSSRQYSGLYRLKDKS